MLPRIPVRLASAWRAAMLVVVSLSLAGPPAPASARADPPVGSVPERGADQAGLAHVHGDLPLSFEANQGQTDPSVDFLARSGGYSVFLSSTQAVLRLRPEGTSRPVQPGQAEPAEQAQPATVVSLSLLDADGQATVAGLDPLPGTANYFLGSDPALWHTGIPTYARVQYAGVYPGIDLVYYGDQGQLEYDFELGPGADPSGIRLAVEGSESAELTAEGGLVLHTAAGELRQPRPVLYQESDDGRQAIDGGYVLNAQQELGFWVGAYDTSRTLTIDPVLVYSTYLGGTNIESTSAIAADTAGNAYVTGVATSADFPTTPGAFQTTTPRHSDDVFVSKLNPTGTALVYSAILGGGLGQDVGRGIAVDGAGNAYITGDTLSADFPTTPGAFQTTLRVSDAFVSKLNPTGTALVYSTFLGGSGGDTANDIAVDGAGNAYVRGITGSADFPTTPGAFHSTFQQGTYVTKLNPTGTALVYSTFLVSDIEDVGAGIAVDGAGNAYVTGVASSPDFPTTPGAFQTTSRGAGDAYVSKLNPTGTALVYSTFLGGSGPDAGLGITVDGAGNAYVVGGTASADFPTTPGAFQTTLRGAGDAFVSKLNPTGTALVYSTFLGGGGGDGGKAIALDTDGNAYVAGDTGSADFPTTPGAFQATFRGGTGSQIGGAAGDTFVVKLNPNGTALVYSSFLGGSGDDVASGIAVDAAGNAYVTGTTGSADFPTTSGAFQTTFRGGVVDAFVAKISTQVADVTAPVTTASMKPEPNAAGFNRTDVTVTLTAADNAGGSGVKSITLRATGAQTIAQTVVTATTASVTITAEGITTLSFFAADNAGNQEAAKTLVVRIDKTAPEARVQFDPVRRDIVVIATDNLSGVPASPIPPISVTPTSAGRDDEDGDGHQGNGERAELRTYLIQDAAGNTLRLVLKVRRDEHELRAQVVSLQINGAAVVTPAQNSLRVELELEKAGQLKELQQGARVGDGKDRQTVEAQFDARDNQTRIEVKQAGTEQKVTRPGLVLLALATNKGVLQVTF